MECPEKTSAAFQELRWTYLLQAATAAPEVMNSHISTAQSQLLVQNGHARKGLGRSNSSSLYQCLSTAGPWHQSYRAARGSLGICNFSFLSNFHELGRPRLRWVNNIRMDLQEVGCGYVDWIGLAQDRDRWRTLVSAVMNLRVP